jgi:hypothetical protein
MKIQVWLRKDGEEKIVNTYTGKDWKGIRCYFDSPKGAYVDYKTNTFVITRSRRENSGSGKNLATCSGKIRIYKEY